jgi:hypothetical protein
MDGVGRDRRCSLAPRFLVFVRRPFFDHSADSFSYNYYLLLVFFTGASIPVAAVAADWHPCMAPDGSLAVSSMATMQDITVTNHTTAEPLLLTAHLSSTHKPKTRSMAMEDIMNTIDMGDNKVESNCNSLRTRIQGVAIPSIIPHKVRLLEKATVLSDKSGFEAAGGKSLRGKGWRIEDSSDRNDM